MIESFCEQCGSSQYVDKNGITGNSFRTRCENCQAVTAHLIGKKSSPKNSEANASAVQNASSSLDKGNCDVKWYHSLQVRFAGFLILLTTIILGSFLTYDYFSTKKEKLGELHSLAFNTATRMSKYLIEPLWGIEEEQLSESLVSEMMDRQIESIIIFDRDTDNILVGRTRDNEGRVINMTAYSDQDSGITTRQPIIRNDNAIGDVEVVVTPKYAMQIIKNLVLKQIIVMGLLYLALLFTVFFILGKLIIRPIKQVTSAADRMSLGDLDITINHTSENEIGLLVDSINRMQASLKIAFTRLHQRSGGA